MLKHIILEQFVMGHYLYLEQSCCSSTRKGASRGALGIWLGCLLDASLRRILGHVLPGRSPEADSGYAGGIMFLRCLGDALVSPWTS